MKPLQMKTRDLPSGKTEPEKPSILGHKANWRLEWSMGLNQGFQFRYSQCPSPLSSPTLLPNIPGQPGIDTILQSPGKNRETPLHSRKKNNKQAPHIYTELLIFVLKKGCFPLLCKIFLYTTEYFSYVIEGQKVCLFCPIDVSRYSE